MNGISSFNYRKLTPEQERRGEKVATVMSIIAILVFLAFCAWGYAQ
jgi:hypothetical protein